MRHKISSGLLMYRVKHHLLEVFIAHPGGPFFQYRNEDCWSIPKGEVESEESLIEAAQREFQEEVGILPHGPYMELGNIRQKSGKMVFAWAFEGDYPDDCPIHSIDFEMEWPPLSGQKCKFPEIDRAGFFPISEALLKLKAAQHPFLTRLAERLKGQLAVP